MIKEIIISLVVGLCIGGFLKLIKLPVPVPHSLGGLVGLIGMFAGCCAVEYISKLLGK